LGLESVFAIFAISSCCTCNLILDGVRVQQPSDIAGQAGDLLCFPSVKGIVGSANEGLGMLDERQDTDTTTNLPAVDYHMGKAINRAIIICLLVAPVAGFFFLQAKTNDHKLALGLITIGALAFAILLFVKQSKPMQTVLGLRRDGIHFTPIGERAFVVPWSEVQGFDLIHYYSPYFVSRLPRFEARADQAAILVSMAWFDANLKPNSVLKQGPFWAEAFVPRGDCMQIVLSHQFINATGQELLTQIEPRWRAWSGRSDNIADRVPATSPRQTRKQDGLFRLAQWWFPLALIGASVAHFWYVPVAYFTDTGPRPAEVQRLHEAILNGGGLVARVAGGPVKEFDRASIARFEAPQCAASTMGFNIVLYIVTTTYETTYLCLQPAQLTDGRSAMGIFRLTPRSMRAESVRVGRFYLDRTFPAWADQLLCARGHCAAKG
jgi:hypothetical protein